MPDKTILLSVAELAEQMHMDVHTIYDLARRENDPLPLRTIKGMKKSSTVLVSDFIDWYRRNTIDFKEVKRNGR